MSEAFDRATEGRVSGSTSYPAIPTEEMRMRRFVTVFLLGLMGLLVPAISAAPPTPRQRWAR